MDCLLWKLLHLVTTEPFRSERRCLSAIPTKGHPDTPPACFWLPPTTALLGIPVPFLGLSPALPTSQNQPVSAGQSLLIPFTYTQNQQAIQTTTRSQNLCPFSHDVTTFSSTFFLGFHSFIYRRYCRGMEITLHLPVRIEYLHDDSTALTTIQGSLRTAMHFPLAQIQAPANPKPRPGTSSFSPSVELFFILYRCGGTWNTIRENLDYIQNAGFTAIWISPVNQNYEGPRSAYGDPYHGTSPSSSRSHRTDSYPHKVTGSRTRPS